MKKLVLFIALALCVAFAGTALAATATGTLGISATVAAAGSCTVTGSGYGFGTVIPPITSNIDIPGYFGVTCPTGTPYAVALSTGGSGNFAQRQMSESVTPANKVSYNVYTDTTYTGIWGDGTSSTVQVNGTGTNAFQQLAPQIRMPAQATPAPGEYLDTLTITVTY